jgi:hypothetical protein
MSIYKKKTEIVNIMEAVFEIEFTDEQIGVLIADEDAIIKRQRGKTFVIACKAILECLSNDESLILVVSRNKMQSKMMKDYINVLLHRLEECIEMSYFIGTNEIKINQSTIKLKEDSRDSLRGYRQCFNYILIDDADLVNNINSLFVNLLLLNVNSIVIGVRTD